MLIVDGQIHLWEKGTPSTQHRQEPFSAEQAIAAMDEAGVDRALVHPCYGIPTRTNWRRPRCADTPTALPSWGGSILTTRKAPTWSRIGKSGLACAVCA